MFDIADKDLFGQVEGEYENPRILDSYFVDNPAFADFRNPSKRFSIVRAKKGMGKSALLNILTYQLSQKKDENFAIRFLGSDISSRNLIKSMDPNSMINEWRVALCNEIALNIAKTIGYASSDHEIKLVEHAELNDMKDRNFFGSILDRIKSATIPSQVKSEIKRPDKILDTYLSHKDSLRVWIIIDDIDATFLNTDQEKLLITTFLSACRRLANEIHGLNIRVSLRTDVWTIVKFFDESMDKVYQYIFDIQWTELQIREMLAKRTRSYMLRKNIGLENGSGKLLSEFDLLDKILVPYFDWGNEKRPSYSVIFTLAHGRPRWVLELCSLAAEQAKIRKLDRITYDDISNTLKEFGEGRKNSLIIEHRHQCEALREVLNSFFRQPKHYSTDQLLKLINNRITNVIDVRIDKSRLRASNLEMANFLYRIGFLTARKDLGKMKYKHYSFEDVPSLLIRGDIDRGYTWEIHPCFRQALELR